MVFCGQGCFGRFGERNSVILAMAGFCEKKWEREIKEGMLQ